MATERSGVNEDWVEMVEKQGVQFLVLSRHDDSDLLKLFQSQPGWTVDFEDGEAIVFARADAAQFTT
jgi:hypothetical protein